MVLRAGFEPITLSRLSRTIEHWKRYHVQNGKRCQAMNEREVSGADSVRKCPICGGELERGYVYAYQGLWWNTKKRSFGYGEELLSKIWRIRNPNFPAKRCKQCQMVIFDYKMKGSL